MAIVAVHFALLLSAAPFAFLVLRSARRVNERERLSFTKADQELKDDLFKLQKD